MSIVMMSALTSVDSIAGEISSHTIQTIATKPLRRWEIIVGKLLGQTLMLIGYVVFMAGGLILEVNLMTGYLPPNILPGLSMMILEGLIVFSITTLGGTTACALYVKRFMEEKGYEVAIFHSGSGIGGRAMEEMIEQGLISAVFDLSTNEVVDNLYGGFTDVGPSRLEAAGKKGIPQVVAPGNVDHIMYTSAALIPDRFKHQKVHVHGPTIHVLRTKNKEIMEVGKVMADKLNKAIGPTAVIIPKKGLSILDITDPVIFKDPEADLALLEVWKQNLKPEIEILELDVHITDERFAQEAATLLYKLMRQGKETG